MLYDLVAERTLERLEFFTLKPKTILEFGVNKTAALSVVFPHTAIEFCPTGIQPRFNKGYFDLIFSNLSLQACDLSASISSFQQLLKPEGLLLFSCLGPDTLKELAPDHPFYDMHDIGDALLRLGFRDPVIDRQDLTFSYSSMNKLVSDLEEYDLSPWVDDNMLSTRAMDEQGPLTITFEIIYAHAWGAEQRQDEEGVSYISVDAIGRSDT